MRLARYHHVTNETQHRVGHRCAVIAEACRLTQNVIMFREIVSFASAASVADWFAIDDGVMGGVSSSHMRHDPAGHAVFEGNVSLERNGGFASVRSRPQDLTAIGATAYVLDACGDGKRYKLNLRTDDGFDGVNYQAAFDAPAGQWVTVRLAVSAFLPTFRGRLVADSPPLDPALVRQIGFMIADRQAGAFALAIRRLHAE